MAVGKSWVQSWEAGSGRGRGNTRREVVFIFGRWFHVWTTANDNVVHKCSAPQVICWKLEKLKQSILCVAIGTSASSTCLYLRHHYCCLHQHLQITSVTAMEPHNPFILPQWRNHADMQPCHHSIIPSCVRAYHDIISHRGLVLKLTI